MKYRLGDICTITKGATGIMKAIPGDFTMVALGEVDKTHNEYQFDAKAAIIPLVSSTGHGHASMKRVKYQEGKFALGSILCAVIPKDEKVVLAKYLHIYLHWNREELLVSQMKGMANVSLSLNKISDVVVIVPSVQKQKEIIELEQQLDAKEKEADKLFADQLTQLENLNQAILQEAVQGKLVGQDPADDPATKLLKRIKTEKTASGKKEKPLAPIKEEEIPFAIPKSWVWCRLGEICSKIGSGSTPKGSNYSKKGFPFFRSQNIHNDGLVYDDIKFVSDEVQKQMNGTAVYTNDILLNITGGSLGRCALVPSQFIEGNVSQHVCIIRPLEVDTIFFHKLVLSPYFQKFIFSSTTGAGREGLPKYNLERFPIPIPPLFEQKRIAAEISTQFEKTRQLKEHIIANQQATEQLLKALLHGAFEVEEKKEEAKVVQVIEFKPRICNLAERTVLAAYLIKQFNSNGFGRVMLMKLLYLIEHVCKLDFNSHYKIKVAGPYDDYLIKEIELTLNKYQLYHSIQDKCDKKQVHYLPLGGVNNIEELFIENFSTETTEINQFVSKFRSSTWDHCEIIATLYAVWNNRIIRNEVITDDFLKQDFLDWDPNKEKYRNRLNESLVWMRKKEIVPDGWGKLVERPES